MAYEFIHEFNQLEERNIGEFESTHQEANQHILVVLDYFREYLLGIRGISLADYPRSTIHLFIGSNYDLLYQSYKLLKRGYFRPALILLRPVYESIILCMYFWEFNEKEKEYREVKNKYGWIKEQGSNPGMIKKINENGKIFTNRERPDMLSNLIVSPLKEINSIVHFSQEYVFFAVTSKDTEKYILGPKKIDEDLMCGLIRSILESSILSMMVMEKAVKCH